MKPPDSLVRLLNAIAQARHDGPNDPPHHRARIRRTLEDAGLGEDDADRLAREIVPDTPEGPRHARSADDDPRAGQGVPATDQGHAG